MTRTIHDYAAAVPIGPVAWPGFDEFGGSLEVTDVSTRDDRVLVTMRWDRYVHPLVLALDPDDVAVLGGYVPSAEADLATWADEATWNLAWAAAARLHETRRLRCGDAIEVVDDDRVDERFLSRHLLPSQWPERWAEFAAHADPVVPPAQVEQWRIDGSLVSWHHVSLEHLRSLPVFGHAASRWRAEGVASVDLLEVSPDLPGPFALLTLADVAHEAAAQGAHTVVCPVPVPDLDLWGFREVDGEMQVDTRFLDIDHDRLERLVTDSADWVPTGVVAEAIAVTATQTYYAG